MTVIDKAKILRFITAAVAVIALLMSAIEQSVIWFGLGAYAAFGCLGFSAILYLTKGSSFKADKPCRIFYYTYLLLPVIVGYAFMYILSK